ncbi:hypothetical protein ANN_28030 [Periplaneta americana]|uniref:Uncharacterized protein n=1 Tax=Periplaneta americana TaxID=6978 RepID=A0ABQ8RV43_PERAM|nr:hypothetical protein ANN_28030 [Periplaneta americana]
MRVRRKKQSENSEPDAAVQKKRTRKDRQINKELRNKGKSYVSEKGKEVKAREMLPLKPCPMNCLEKFLEEDRQKCFEEYWAIGNHDNRVRYISSLITISKPKTHRVVEDNAKLREIVCKYEIIIQGNNQPICRECFRRTFEETTGFVERVASKKRESFSGIIAPDDRVKFALANKTKIEDLQSEESHIFSFPSYESHYCRNRNSKRFLSSDLNISKRCFHKLDLAFKKPKQDTCHKCDVLKMKINTLAGEARDSAIQERDTHHKAAEESYEAKRYDKELAQKDDRKAVLAFDLQQCLPTPYLTTSVSYYKRQLWTFNLTVHNLVADEATCFMWNETTSGRGANQIGSCLYQFILQLPGHVEEITFYSGSCGGQNRNSIVTAMFSFVIDKNPNIHEIHHKFLVNGHTHIECDADHECELVSAREVLQT